MTSKPPASPLDKYFTSSVNPAKQLLQDELDSTHMVEQADLFRRMRTRLLVRILLSGLVCWTASWWLYQRREDLAYHFSSNQIPVQFGDAKELTPASIPHNRYVCLQGLTEHRGLQQQAIRGPTLFRQELWLMRLVGSQGIFIETIPDNERFGFSQQVEVCGRALDPALDGAAAGFLDKYHQTFSVRQRPTLRLIEVDVRPGSAQWLYVGWMALLLVLLSLHGLAWWNMLVLLRSPWRLLGLPASSQTH